MDIYEFLKAQAAAHGSVAALARACDVSKQALGQWLSDNPRERLTPSPASCKKIASGLGLDLDYVLEMAGHREQREEGERPHDELAAMIDHYEALLRDYPRSFWAPVLEANQRMVEAARTLGPVVPESQEVRAEGKGPASSPERGPVEDPERAGSNPSWSANHQKKAPIMAVSGR